jgi:hypothetical protein
MSRRTLALGTALVLGLLACQEELTVRGSCPDLCPGGTPVVEDIVLPVLPGSDTSHVGYISHAGIPALLVSNGIAAGEARAWYRFEARPDTVFTDEGYKPYTIDSVALTVPLVVRDTLVKDLRVYLHRVSYGIDTTVTFEGLDTLLVEGSLIDSIAVHDTLRRGTLRLVLSGDALSRVELPAEDSGRLAVGVRVAADQPTGVRLGSTLSSVGAATFLTYIRTDVADTSRRRQTLTMPTVANGYLKVPDRVTGPDLLYLGGLPSARALLRFRIPQVIRDSAIPIRATLELEPAEPLRGLRSDFTAIQARGVGADFGAKSSPDLLFLQSPSLQAEGQEVVSIDVLSIVESWRGPRGRPQVIYLSLEPEGGSFHEPVFHSSRSPSGGPRIRITYVLPPRVERP